MTINALTPAIVGWDVGGAHLKAVQIDADGRVLAVEQVYCPLWRGLAVLEQAIDEVLMRLSANQHVVTMTGELADIFPNRHTGVDAIARTLHRKLTAHHPQAQLKFFTRNLGGVAFGLLAAYTHEIASMNWYASAQFLATKVETAIFVDIGSTTTDIALLQQGKPGVRGLTDATRMACDELVYTGVVRTPLMALGQKVPFRGKWVNVAAEHFATTADVYMLSGDISSSDYVAETADGMEKNSMACARRIARMIGWDAEDAPFSSWEDLACAFKAAQSHQIRQALLTQLSLRADDRNRLKVIGAGVGAFLIKEIAVQLGLDYLAASSFIKAENGTVKAQAEVCFPAYAVASLEVV
ncbi:MAG: H4MPT-linked C1 transfer pathway protein [Betaproteobacteria bacterium HGW-Betaproteobacteria-22]|nr:MAG: H4MPT-linked C1 transfer pathway protein [Betaproteobacteria bacterium HGW-Betaproteobacteria-22]